MNRNATITLQDEGWSGWVRDGEPPPRRTQVTVAQGAVLGPALLREGPAATSEHGTSEPASMAYEVVVERIEAERVCFLYRRLVLTNDDGTINLTAPNTGRFTLGFGASRRLDTPTMDAGITVTVTLDDIV